MMLVTVQQAIGVLVNKVFATNSWWPHLISTEKTMDYAEQTRYPSKNENT